MDAMQLLVATIRMFLKPLWIIIILRKLWLNYLSLQITHAAMIPINYRTREGDRLMQHKIRVRKTYNTW